MALKIKKNGWIALTVIVALVAVFIKTGWYDNLAKFVGGGKDVQKVILPNEVESTINSSIPMLSFAGKKPSFKSGAVELRWVGFTWASKLGAAYANGGSQTTEGSLVEKAGWNITMEKQEDCNKISAELVKYAKELKEGTATKGVFVTYMGSGVPAFIQGINESIKQSGLGREYEAVIVAISHGRSDGEDQVMGPPSILQNIDNIKGMTLGVVPMDGDEDIFLKWLGDNTDSQGQPLKYNSNPKYYDPEAVNVIHSDDFLQICQMYNSGYTEKKQVIGPDGKTTGESKTVGIDLVTTWTPGDVLVAQGRGGLCRIASTHEYPTIMPNVTLTIRRFYNEHIEEIADLTAALAQAGDQIRSYTEAKEYAAKCFVDIYKEQDVAYWLKYTKGVEERDVTGLKVKLGGSKVFNLNDMASLYGLGEDGIDRYKITYTVFGDFKVKYYPNIIPSYPKYEDVIDKRSLIRAIEKYPELLQGKIVETKYAAEMTREVSSKSVAIEFDLGKSTIRPSAFNSLQGILEDAIMAENLKIRIEGHTDVSGNADINDALSSDRANSVKLWLVSKGIKPNRIETQGYGSHKLLNGLAPTDARHRRVQIILGE